MSVSDCPIQDCDGSCGYGCADPCVAYPAEVDWSFITSSAVYQVIRPMLDTRRTVSLDLLSGPATLKRDGSINPDCFDHRYAFHWRHGQSKYWKRTANRKERRAFKFRRGLEQ